MTADLQNPYRQLPSETGGQAYHMECEFCHEWGSMYSSAPFIHAADCPAGKLEQEEFAAMRKREQEKKGTTMEPTVELTKGQKVKRMFLRGLVRLGYLVLLGLLAGVCLGMMGVPEGPHPVLLLGVMLIYWGTIGKILTKFGIAKQPKVPPVTAVK